MMGTDRSFSRKALLRNLHAEMTLGEGGEMLGMIFTGDGCPLALPAHSGRAGPSEPPFGGHQLLGQSQVTVVTSVCM